MVRKCQMLFKKTYWDNAPEELNIDHHKKTLDHWNRSFFGTEVDFKDYNDEETKNDDRFQELTTCDNTEDVIFKYVGNHRDKYCRRCLFEYGKIRNAIQWMNNIQAEKEYKANEIT